MADRKQRNEREALTREFAKLGGLSYADQLEDGAESLYPYYPQADALIAAGFGFRGEAGTDWEYADADTRGSILRGADSWSYMGPVTPMRRRKAGPWEPVPQTDSEES